jgi:hypothetical protein
MAEPIIPIHVIDRDAKESALVGAPESSCPYPSDSAAGIHWLDVYRAKKKELRGESTIQLTECVG